MTPVGPPRTGTFVVVVGPSGAGKDTMIDYARARLDASAFVFARRVITRPAAAGEDHEPVSDAEFRKRLAGGSFALHWQVHGLSYGIPAIVDDWLAGGIVVVANVSRAVVAEARRRYPKLLVVSVTAPIDVLAKRLSRRGRETEAEIKERLARTEFRSATGRDVLEIDNAGPPCVAGEQLVRTLLERT